MRVTQSESVSSPRRGSGNRLGVRTRKKHKRLDLIDEDVFNRNRGGEMGGGEGGEGRGRSVERGEGESEVRRSGRTRRAPLVLDSSPPPRRKRRKIESDGKGNGKGKGKVEKGSGGLGFGSSEEELGSWRSRYTTRGRGRGRGRGGGWGGGKTSGKKPSGKRKLFEDEEEMIGVKDEFEDEGPCLDGEGSGVVKVMGDGIVGGSNDAEDEVDGDHLVEERLENGVDHVENGDDGGCGASTSGESDGNEEIRDGFLVHTVEKESEVSRDVLLEEKVNRGDNVEEREPIDELENLSKLVENGEKQQEATESTALPTKRAKRAEDDGNNEINKLAEAEAEVKRAEVENGAKAGNCKVAADGIRRKRIKEGRRCGLCGGGIDGKPPKRLANDSAGSDHEAYSGSSGSEECNYDEWDGFGEEPGWLGKLLGPINDRHGIAGIWVHQHCAVWSPEVYFAGLGCLKNVRAALCRGRALKCTRCARPGATLGCRVDRCPRTYHLPCARASGCGFDHRKFLIACADHRYLFQPHGDQYAKRIKKLKAKKMRLEMKKVSNDASRKDLEAEEKWLEKCGEDEEFLRRETKRLQRDLLRTAPVYIGGSHSEGKNAFGGWESVAGLQDVMRCLKEVVILPLLYPEFFDNMGIAPPRGVLLHGYPGTGKTLIVRALIGSCARGDKRIAYFARKGADCLGKYVGDAERQLRLLFQVAEKSQPSIIFFDEIDGLAPVRTRQQDQTHSSVVSTLLALMDGLKSRGSVIVIGATNRPDSVDPALRRPGRFDREIYFPLPSVKDRAAILALHTRKWPKPVAGPLLEWVADRTVGFAGADLQALCAQAAVIALKRNCCWHQILSSAGDQSLHEKRPDLPSFVVEERDWLEALSLAPPPCSRREAGMAANEVIGTPLHMHLIPCLLQPLLCLIISLYQHDRIWLPHRLVNAGAAIKRAVVSVMKKKSQESDKWWCHVQNVAQDSEIVGEIVRNLCFSGILDDDASFAGSELSNELSSDDDEFKQSTPVDNPSGLFRSVCYVPLKKTGYRILISGDPKSGQKHLASCLLHCFVGNIEMQKIDLATISQEGHGDMERGISHILMKCASLRQCAVFMPRIDLWAILACSQTFEKGVGGSPNPESVESSPASCESGGEESSILLSTSESVEPTESQNEISHASQTWKSFVEQLECICVSSSLILIATSELPCSAFPREILQFFGTVTSEASVVSEFGTPRFCVEVDGEFDCNLLIHSSALDLARDLIQQFVQLVHLVDHGNSDSSNVDKVHHEDIGGTYGHKTELKSVEESGARKLSSEDPVTKLSASSGCRNMKGKSTLVFAITTFGYQILRYPHFAELCWITSKLTEGPSADICGPWKGWPFNSCVVRPCKSMRMDTVACNSNIIKGKGKFTSVRGLIAVGLSAYRGLYTSPAEVSLEVRRVLELLVGQIGARILGGKDRYQYFHLLSQIAYLEDMVNNWSHSLKSLEPDVQTSAMNSKLNGFQSPDNLQIPAAIPTQPEEEPYILGSRFQEIPHVTGGLQGSVAESSRSADVIAPTANSMHFEETRLVEDGGFLGPELVEVGLQEPVGQSPRSDDLNLKIVDVGISDLTDSAVPNEKTSHKAVSENRKAPESYHAGEDANQDSSPNKVAWVNKLVCSANSENSAAVSQPCGSVSIEKCSTKHKVSSPSNFEDLTITCGQLRTTPQSNQLACTESLDQQIAGTSELKKVELCGSTEIRHQSDSGPAVENLISAEARMPTNNVHLPDSNLSSETASEIVCSYSCCVRCIHNLHQLMKTMLTQEWELTGSSCTLEDVHDLVLSVSARLCSTIRNLYVSGRTSSGNDELRSEAFSNIFESQETSACGCPMSENKLNKVTECVCHPGNDVSDKGNRLSSSNQLGFHPKYIFRDGVLVSVDPDKESSFHCKYSTLCLCSLIELIESTK